jgi:hypothetical protein
VVGRQGCLELIRAQGPVVETSVPKGQDSLFASTMWNKLAKGAYDPWIESVMLGQVRAHGVD